MRPGVIPPPTTRGDTRPGLASAEPSRRPSLQFPVNGPVSLILKNQIKTGWAEQVCALQSFQEQEIQSQRSKG